MLLAETNTPHETLKYPIGTWVWIPDDDHVWKKAQINEYETNKKLKVLLDDTAESKIIPLETLIYLCNLEELKETRERIANLHDLTHLTHLHEASVLQSLDTRFSIDQIYTFTGPILIAINPFKLIDGLYSPQKIQSFHEQESNVSRVKPHVFSIASTAYKNLCSSQTSQTILISGESGAGKTESTKYVMKFLAYAGCAYQHTSSSSSVENRILESNPLLETFGNAKTLRNENSSRFGKFIEMQFKLEPKNKYNLELLGKLVGASIKTYLLETVRVCRQLKGERNFHSFYQLCAATEKVATTESKIYSFPSLITEPAAKKCTFDFSMFKSVENFRYLTQSQCLRLTHVDDLRGFEETVYAMQIIGIPYEEQVAFFNLLGAILYLGNINFDVIDLDANICRLSEDTSDFDMAVKLLHVDRDSLAHVLTNRTIKTNNEECEIPLKLEDCCAYRDSLAKALYKTAFMKVVESTNESLGHDTTTQLTCGVLDIFGFECFPMNSFEQLCINFTNERLQQFFNDFVFRCEEAEYNNEGIPWDSFEFPDNQDCVELLENRTSGVFAMIDEEGFVPQGSDLNLCSKMKTRYKEHPRFFLEKTKAEMFTVNHFAGPVKYCVTEFLEKNKDQLSMDVQNCILNSKSQFIANLFKNYLDRGSSNKQTIASEKQKSNRLITVSYEFIKQLGDLMTTIKSTEPHFIRCIRPNYQNVPITFDRCVVTEQLRYGGVLQAIQVSRAGYPVRVSHNSVFVDYWPLYGHSAEKMKLCSSTENMKERVTCMLQKLDMQHKFPLCISGAKGWAVGKAKVFLKHEVYEILTNMMRQVHSKRALQIQTSWRRYKTRKWFLYVIHLITKIQSLGRGYLGRKYFRSVLRYKAARTIQTAVLRYMANKKYKAQKSAALDLQAKLRYICATTRINKTNRHRCATRIQAAYRCYTQVKAYRNVMKKTVSLQLWWKHKLAKRRLEFLRMERRNAEVLHKKVQLLENELNILNKKHESELASLKIKYEEMLAAKKPTVVYKKKSNALRASAKRSSGVSDKTFPSSKEPSVTAAANVSSRKSHQARTPSPNVSNFHYSDSPEEKTAYSEDKKIYSMIRNEQMESPGTIKNGVFNKDPEYYYSPSSRSQTKKCVEKTVSIGTVTHQESSADKSKRPPKLGPRRSQRVVKKNQVHTETQPSLQLKKKMLSNPITKTNSIVSHSNYPLRDHGSASFDKRTIQATSILRPNQQQQQPRFISQNKNAFIFESTNEQGLGSGAFTHRNNTNSYIKHEHSNTLVLNLLILGATQALTKLLKSGSSNCKITRNYDKSTTCPFINCYDFYITRTGSSQLTCVGHIQDASMQYYHGERKHYLIQSLFRQCLIHWIEKSSAILIVYDMTDTASCNQAFTWMRLMSSLTTPQQSSHCYCYGHRSTRMIRDDTKDTDVTNLFDASDQNVFPTSCNSPDKTLTVVKQLNSIHAAQKQNMTLLEAILHVQLPEFHENKSSLVDTTKITIPAAPTVSLPSLSMLNNDLQLFHLPQHIALKDFYKEYLTSGFSDKKQNSDAKNLPENDLSNNSTTESLNPVSNPYRFLYPSLEKRQKIKKSAEQMSSQNIKSSLFKQSTCESLPILCTALGYEFNNPDFYLLAAAHPGGRIVVYKIQRTFHEKKAYIQYMKKFRPDIVDAENIKSCISSNTLYNDNSDVNSNLNIEVFSQFGISDSSVEITCLAFLPADSHYLVAACKDCIIRIWNVMTCHVDRMFKDTSHSVMLTFLPSNPSIFFTSNVNSTLRLVDSNCGTVLQRLQYPTPISTIAFDAPGKQCFLGSMRGFVYLISLKSNFTFENKFQKKIALTTITCMSCIPASSSSEAPQLIVSTLNSALYILECAYDDKKEFFIDLIQKQTLTLEDPIQHCMRHCYSNVGLTWVISGSAKPATHIVSLSKSNTSGKEITLALEDHASPIVSVEISASNTVLVTAEERGILTLWRSEELL